MARGSEPRLVNLPAGSSRAPVGSRGASDSLLIFEVDGALQERRSAPRAGTRSTLIRKWYGAMTRKYALLLHHAAIVSEAILEL